MDLKRYIPFLIIRLLSLYLFLQGLSFLPMTLSMYTPKGQNTFLYQSPTFLILVFSIILWAFSNPISAFISKGFNFSLESDEPINGYSLEYVLISLVGLFIIVTTIPSMFGLISYHYSMGSLANVFSHKAEIMSSFYMDLTKHTAKIILGLILIVLSKKITNLFRNIRFHSEEKSDI